MLLSTETEIRDLAALVGANAETLAAMVAAWDANKLVLLPHAWYDARDFGVIRPFPIPASWYDSQTITGSEPPPPPPPPPDPLVPAFDSGNAVALDPSMSDLAAVIDFHPAGTHFRFTAGMYANAEDIRPRAGDHFRGPEEGNGYAYLSGLNKGYGFRAHSAQADDVAIGRLTLADYGGNETRQDYAGIMAKPTDVIGGAYSYSLAQNWVLYDLTLARNGPSGIHLSDYCTVVRTLAFGHTVTGINGDRFVGGHIEDCDLEANSLDPASGAASNGANLKVTWVNAGIGRTSQTNPDRTPAPFRIVNVRSRATRDGVAGACPRGIWLDLDCRDFEITGTESWDLSAFAIFAEGCNSGWVHHNIAHNCDGYGPAFNKDYANAAYCLGETTNTVVEDNEAYDCNYALMNRLSRRADWYTSANNGVNYAWPTGPRYWMSESQTIPAPGGLSNIWTGANTWRRNKLVNCNKVVINEGTNSASQTTHGATPLSTIVFDDNDYSGSPGIGFYHASNTELTLAQWRALPYTRDQ